MGCLYIVVYLPVALAALASLAALAALAALASLAALAARMALATRVLSAHTTVTLLVVMLAHVLVHRHERDGYTRLLKDTSNKTTLCCSARSGSSACHL